MYFINLCYNALFLCAARQNQRNRSATRKGGGRQTNGRSMSNGASLNLSQGFNSQASQVKCQVRHACCLQHMLSSFM